MYLASLFVDSRECLSLCVCLALSSCWDLCVLLEQQQNNTNCALTFRDLLKILR